MSLVFNIKDGDWTSVRQAIAKLASIKLGPTSSPTFASTSLTELTASRLVSTDSSKAFSSVADLTSWIDGTDNQIIATDDGDGTLTLSLATAVTSDILENAKRYSLMLSL